VRQDSVAMFNSAPLQACMSNDSRTEICKIQPGVYTLMIFGTNAQVCSSVAPWLYVDRVGTSRFDHAKNAYEFGVVPPDNVYYNGKVGEVNPLHPGRAASNDFFYCTTGAQVSDPNGSACYSTHNPNIYNQPDTNNVLYPVHTTNDNIARRNLWYSFQVSKPGWVSVKVDSKSPNRQDQLNYAIYKSDVNGSLSLAQVVTAGSLDSTIAQGLTLIRSNAIPGTLVCDGFNDVSFFCTAL